MRLIAVAMAGVVLGALGARVLFVGSGLSLILWAAVAVGIGALSTDRNEAWLGGAAFGGGVSLAFLLAGYDGTTGPIARTAFFAVLGAVGTGCGALLAWIGYRVRPTMRSQMRSRSDRR